MRAAVARQDGITVEDIDEPTPGSGHVVVKPLACGICGSDLHAAKDLRHFCELTTSVGGLQTGLDPDAGIVFGHEYVAEILDHGPDTMKTLPVGTHVCAVPILVGSTGVQSIGYSNLVPGALADQMLLQEMLLLPVPEGVAPERAALTEPLAVGEHAVASAGLQGDEACLVIGCGPVGLAVIMALKERGAGPIIAADFAPGRRHLAERLGADQVVDPAEVSPYSKWSELGVPANGMERMAADMMGGTAKDAVIFEAVGVPGIIQQIIEGAPPKARVVVVGVCMETDQTSRSSPSPRSCRSGSCSGTRPTSTRPRCSASPRPRCRSTSWSPTSSPSTRPLTPSRPSPRPATTGRSSSATDASRPPHDPEHR